jgi:hypothetical protein
MCNDHYRQHCLNSAGSMHEAIFLCLALQNACRRSMRALSYIFNHNIYGLKTGGIKRRIPALVWMVFKTSKTKIA